MAVVINGSGTVTGLAVGGLPDGTVDAGTLADDAVGLAQMASGTDGNLITYDTSGNPAAVAVGTSGQVLTSNGAGAAPTFQAAAGGNDPYFMAYNNSAQTISHATATVAALSSEVFDPDSVFNTSTYRFTVPSGKAGKYLFQYGTKIENMNGTTYYSEVYPKVNNSYSNSTTSQGHCLAYGNSSQNSDYNIGSKMFNLSVGDYVELIVTGAWGGGTRDTSSSYKTFMSGMRIGD